MGVRGVPLGGRGARVDLPFVLRKVDHRMGVGPYTPNLAELQVILVAVAVSCWRRMMRSSCSSCSISVLKRDGRGS